MIFSEKPVSTFPDHALEIPQCRKQRDAEQRGGAEQEAEHEHPETAATRLLFGDRLDDRSSHHRVLAFDHAARDIVGDGVDDDRDVMRLSEHDAAKRVSCTKR